ncbi:peptide ABC transporter substrate-binding protein [Sporanaerobacter acetigenes]|uniref:Oligopeptide transport system substrate-binding protein n=1 Tax=Sporanaerobacter acetigenes DSM 13106 TaxID=1123281 RepID=A0A1M5S3A0_9FIRM|nr:peptide ABC transporter substrate-binding protein [Sporanaerobacter acetigenes]SHH32443.1 oligopeptide transport system substrate-binding protein [Sporanaerobacter acetigenes DSM 13106]
MRKHKWLVLLLVLAMVLSLALTGCGKDEDTPPANSEEEGGSEEEVVEDGEKLADEQILKLNWGSEPPDLDPQTTTDAVSIEILNAVYEGLVRLQPDGTVSPGLAESWDISDDQLTYTFHLRDAKWSDGTPITAEDFEYAWFRAIDPKVAAQYSYQLTDTGAIKNAGKYFNGEITDKEQVGIKALDEKTFQVELERPIPFFLSLTSFVTFIPPQKAAVESFGDTFASEADKMIYSGPFIVSEWEHEQKLVLKKNENYWDAENVKLEEVRGDMITDSNTAINLYETGELDITGVPPEFLDNYKDTEEFINLAEATTWYIQYNCEDKYLQNKNLRYALSYAIDVQSFVDNVLNNGSIAAGGLTPTLLPGKDGKEFAENRGDILPKYDAAKAKEYFDKALEELGVSAEEIQKHLTFLTDDNDIAKKRAAAIQNMWKQNLGIEVKIETVSFKIRIDRYDRKDYTTTFAGWGGDYNDPLTFMDLFVTGGGNNTAYWSNEGYDAAIKKAQTGMGDERIDAMLEAENILAEEMPVFPVFYRARNFVQRTYVKDVARFPVGSDIDFKWAYIIEH